MSKSNPRNLLCLFLFSCIISACTPVITFEYLDLSCSVAEGQDYYYADYVTFNFSQKPDYNDIEKKIRFQENDSAIVFDKKWDGSTLSIRPHLLWQKGRSYSVDLQGIIRMDDGRSYTAGIYRTFMYGERGNEFELIANDFANNILTFSFSAPVLVTSFNEKFTLAPFTEYDADFSPGMKEVRVSPKDGWTLNAAYSWEINNMISAHGYIMNKAYSGIFYGKQDIEQPVLEEVCPVDHSILPALWFTGTALDHNLLESQAIGFEFSKPMDEASVKNGIGFNPSINGYIIKETDYKYIFIPEEPYELRKEYRVTVSDSVKDSSGLSLYEQKLIFFTTANDYLEITSVVFDDSAVVIPLDGTVFGFTMQPVILPTDPVLKSDVYFSTAIPPENRHDAVNSVSLSALFPDSAKIPVLVSALWFNGGSCLTLNWNNFSVSTAGIDDYYMLTISGGKGKIENGAGEYVKEDVCVTFITRP
jgi:hypothetical protein